MDDQNLLLGRCLLYSTLVEKGQAELRTEFGGMGQFLVLAQVAAEKEAGFCPPPMPVFAFVVSHQWQRKACDGVMGAAVATGLKPAFAALAIAMVIADFPI